MSTLKRFLLVSLAFAACEVFASEQDINSRQISDSASKALVMVSEGLLQARLDGACSMNVDYRYQQSISNISDCKEEIESQIEAISSSMEFSSYLFKLESFKSRYDL